MSHPVFTDGFVNVNGVRLHFVDYGGPGDTLVVLPGLIQNARVSRPIASLLSPHLRIVSFDFRGRGQSDWSAPELYRIDQYLRDFTAFLAALGLERVSLLGTSLGGLVARLFSTAYPQRVSRLVLNDCAIGGMASGFEKALKRPAGAPREFVDLDDAVAWFSCQRSGLRTLDESTRRNWVSYYLARGEDGWLRFECDPAVFRVAESTAKLFAAKPREWVETELAWQHAQRLSMPLLIIRGAMSDVIASETVARLAQVLPDASFVEIEGVGHSPTLCEPAAQLALREFFGLSAGTGPNPILATGNAHTA